MFSPPVFPTEPVVCGSGTEVVHKVGTGSKSLISFQTSASAVHVQTTANQFCGNTEHLGLKNVDPLEGVPGGLESVVQDMPE